MIFNCIQDNLVDQLCDRSLAPRPGSKSRPISVKLSHYLRRGGGGVVRGGGLYGRPHNHEVKTLLHYDTCYTRYTCYTCYTCYNPTASLQLLHRQRAMTDYHLRVQVGQV